MDLLFHNGIIQSVDSNNTIYDAIGVEDGKIMFLGTNEEASKIKATKKIDLEKKLMLPGFMDTHVHMIYYALSKESVDLSSCLSIDEIIDKVKFFLASNGISRGWLVGRGWNQNHFTDNNKFVTRDDLDKISTKYPIACSRSCEHLVSLNSLGLEKVLELEGIHSVMNFIDIKNGILREDAISFLNKLINNVSHDDLKSWILDGQKDLNRQGITTIHSADFVGIELSRWEDIIKVYEELDRENKLTVKVYEQCMFINMADFDEFISKGYKTGQGSSNFKIGPLKLILDGSLGARTASMKSPYLDDPSTCGILNFSEDELEEVVRKAYDNNLQVAVHGIGDNAISIIVDTYGKLDKEYCIKDRRNGIVHGQFTNEELLEKMAKNNILAYIQPIFINDDMNTVEPRVGKDRMKKIYAWKTMRDMGIHTTGSSDAPITKFNILENIYSAVTRKTLKGFPENGWLPDEKLFIDEAVRLFTIDSAYASFEEYEKGSLEMGKCADMVVLDKNIYEINSEELLNTNVSMTIVNGDIVFNNL